MSDSNPQLSMQTSEGTIVLELWPDIAPKHVDSFMALTRQGFYDGLNFHRILPGFVIQGGCPRGDGTGGPGYNVPAEFNDTKHDKGILSMARSSDPNSAGSQFFLCLGREHCQHLDKQYTAFGEIVEGLDVLDAIAATPLADSRSGRPKNPPTIDKLTVVEG